MWVGILTGTYVGGVLQFCFAHDVKKANPSLHFDSWCGVGD
jgi:hypothetical protein